MRESALVIVFFQIICVFASATDDENITSCLLSTGLPLVSIETVNHEEPVYDVVYAPEGLMGRSIKNATKVPSHVTISTQKDGIVFDSGTFEEMESGATIKIRGNTTASIVQKPYKIKLQKKADLLLRGNNEFKDKNWVLLPVFNLNLPVGLKVNELIGLQWTPAYCFVNVIFNGDYKGMYMLVESVGRNAACRLDVDKETGYIFELDAYWWNEPVYVESSFNERSNYTFKYPDQDDITEDQKAYFQNYILELEKSLDDGNYDKYIDIESFANWMLAHDILGGIDGAGSNLFLTKYDNTSETKTMMGPLWDMDVIMKAQDKWDAAHYYAFFKHLFKSSDKTFLSVYLSRWEEVGIYIIEQLLEYIDSFVNSPEGEAFTRSVYYHNIRWAEYEYSHLPDGNNVSKYSCIFQQSEALAF